MKVYLANPPFIKNFNRQVRWSAKTSGALHPPIYLAYAAANLKKNGFEVRLKDAVAEEMTTRKFVNDVVKYKPDLLVMETSTPSIVNDSKLVDLIKEKLKKVKVVFSGGHVSSLPERSLKESKADFVFLAEYDTTLVKLAKKLQKKESIEKLKGIAYKKGRSIKVNPKAELLHDVDKLPWPLREQLPIAEYRDTLLTAPFTFIVTARGCPFQCTYCNWPNTMYGHGLRRRDATDVVDEIEHCIKTYKLKSYKLFDDTFTVDKKHVQKVCNDLIQRGINTPWICNARVDTLDEETMRLMKKSGCYLFKIGVESGDQTILDWVKKGTNISQVREFFKLTKKVGIETFASFMIGFPQDTDETINKTFELAKEIEPDYLQFVILQPLPGTELYNWMEQEKMLPKDIEWDKYITEEGYVDIIFDHPNYSQKELREIASRLWKGYYLRPKYIAKRALMGLTSWRHMKNNLEGFKKIFRYEKKE